MKNNKFAQSFEVAKLLLEIKKELSSCGINVKLNLDDNAPCVDVVSLIDKGLRGYLEVYSRIRTDGKEIWVETTNHAGYFEDYTIENTTENIEILKICFLDFEYQTM